MDLDVNTLFQVTMHIEIMLGLLLFFAWAQNFSKRALAWWGSAHLMRAEIPSYTDAGKTQRLPSTMARSRSRRSVQFIPRPFW